MYNTNTNQAFTIRNVLISISTVYGESTITFPPLHIHMLRRCRLVFSTILHWVALSRVSTVIVLI